MLLFDDIFEKFLGPQNYKRVGIFSKGTNKRIMKFQQNLNILLSINHN